MGFIFSSELCDSILSITNLETIVILNKNKPDARVSIPLSGVITQESTDKLETAQS